MATTIPGGFYFGVDGKHHDAEGKPIVKPVALARPEPVEKIEPAAPVELNAEADELAQTGIISKGKAAKGK